MSERNDIIFILFFFGMLSDAAAYDEVNACRYCNDGNKERGDGINDGAVSKHQIKADIGKESFRIL